MSEHETDIKETIIEDAPFGANAIRLSMRQWGITGLIVLVCACGIPELWAQLEGWTLTEDYRVPSALSEDYWVYEQYANATQGHATVIPIIGDSVIWGQYVKPDETLSHSLNALYEDVKFANLGVNGIHPIALSGLVEHYGDAFTNRKVILNYNPLWMSSARRDLQLQKPMRFNHPRLVPQFFPAIPMYRESTVNRMSIAITHNVPLFKLNTHFRIAYFGQEDFPAWTVSNPYENPLSAISMAMPMPLDVGPSPPIPWMEKSDRLQSFSWIPPELSSQWAYFKQAVATLEARGNEVFVIFGPFNTHLLTEENKVTYLPMEDMMTQWLKDNDVAYVAPAPLASELYADASHPIPAGYVVLADVLLASESFQAFIAAE
jgi:hypothetical protein